MPLERSAASVQGMAYGERVCLAEAVGAGCLFLSPFVIGLRRCSRDSTEPECEPELAS